jgi:hypothetical protein
MSMALLSDQVDEREVRVILRELETVLKKDINGDVVEFGCYVGTTSVFLASRLKTADRKLYLYDSFEGLPSGIRLRLYGRFWRPVLLLLLTITPMRRCQERQKP